MRYVVSRYNAYQYETAYRIYITDSLRIITENTAFEKGHPYLTTRWADIMYSKPKEKEKETGGNEIATNIIKKFGIEVV